MNNKIKITTKKNHKSLKVLSSSLALTSLLFSPSCHAMDMDIANNFITFTNSHLRRGILESTIKRSFLTTIIKEDGVPYAVLRGKIPVYFKNDGEEDIDIDVHMKQSDYDRLIQHYDILIKAKGYNSVIPEVSDRRFNIFDVEGAQTFISRNGKSQGSTANVKLIDPVYKLSPRNQEAEITLHQPVYPDSQG